MANYIDYVLLEDYRRGNIPLLVQAPSFSHLEEGMTVCYRDENMHEHHAVVIGSVTVDVDSEEANFIRLNNCFKSHDDVAKIIKKVREIEVRWDD